MPGYSSNFDNSRTNAYCACSRCCFDNFITATTISFFSPSYSETVHTKCCITETNMTHFAIMVSSLDAFLSHIYIIMVHKTKTPCKIFNISLSLFVLTNNIITKFKCDLLRFLVSQSIRIWDIQEIEIEDRLIYTLAVCI